MLTLRVDADTVSRTRLAPSPASESMAWLRLTAAAGRHPVFGDPGPLARASLSHPDVALLADLLPRNGDTYAPDFLTPQPATHAQRRDLLDEQIAQIEATAQDDLETQVFTHTRTHWSRPLRVETRRIAESGRMQRHLANGLARFWRDTLSDGWPDLCTTIDQDITRRATAIATHGVGRTFEALHPDMGWAGDAITLASSWDAEIDATGRDLVLVPTVLGRPAVVVQVDTPGQVVLYYPAQRIGAGRDRGSGSIAPVVGNARAALLADLDTARSTAELASRSGYTPGTVSYHLGALHRARLVTRVRAGRYVLYQRTAHAADLLDDVSDPQGRGGRSSR
ncbi:MAG: helix-turn-helix transcriptional regulator [Saccharothrix sp.]|nr:helix-turn-helix transcriptional regulator [Saccharothrix sp.]